MYWYGVPSEAGVQRDRRWSGTRFMPFGHDSCHWHTIHVIGTRFMPFGHDSCHWDTIHAIGTRCMSFGHDACHSDTMHVIGTRFMPLGHDSCHWHPMHVIRTRGMSLATSIQTCQGIATRFSRLGMAEELLTSDRVVAEC